MQFLRNDAGGARPAEGRPQQSVRVDRDQIRQDEGLADELGQQAGDVALAWLLSQPAVTAPIIGPRTQEQRHAALCALDVEVDEPTLIRLHQFVPACRTVLEACGW